VAWPLQLIFSLFIAFKFTLSTKCPTSVAFAPSKNSSSPKHLVVQKSVYAPVGCGVSWSMPSVTAAQSRISFVCLAVLCSDLYSGAGRSAPLLLAGSQYLSPTDDVTLFGHVPRPTWSPAYAAAAAAAAAAYCRYRAAATLAASPPCPPSPFTAQFPPAGTYLGLNDRLGSVGGYCGSVGVQGGEVGRCLKSLRCDLNNLPALHSSASPPTSWQRPCRGNCH